MAILRGNSTFKTILLILIGVMVLAGAVFGIMKLVEFGNKETKTISPSYSLGTLDENGKYVSAKDTLYTKDMFECLGLQTEIDFDATVKYQIYFYNLDKTYISHTNWLADSYDVVPAFARYARIVIKPADDDNISTLEKLKYSKQVKLTVLKKQTVKDVSSFAVDSSRNGKTISAAATTFTLTTDSDNTYVFSKDINCFKAAEVEVAFKGETGNPTLWFIDSTTGVVDSVELDAEALKTKSDGLYHTTIKVPEGSYKLVLQIYTADNTAEKNLVYVR